MTKTIGRPVERRGWEEPVGQRTIQGRREKTIQGRREKGGRRLGEE